MGNWKGGGEENLVKRAYLMSDRFFFLSFSLSLSLNRKSIILEDNKEESFRSLLTWPFLKNKRNPTKRNKTRKKKGRK